MLTRRVIPSLLLRNGRLVKGVGYAAWRDAGNPATTARVYNAQGADELLLLDIEASRQNRAPDYASVAVVAKECSMPLTVGGGINSVERAHACMEHGADKICVTSTALDRPELIAELAHVFGRQAVVLGIDVTRAGQTRALYDHRTGKPAPARRWQEWMKEGVARGAGEIRLMAVDREGRRTGLDSALLKEAAELVDVPIILEGGAGSLDQLDEAMTAGVEAVALGTLLVFSDNNIIKVKRFLSGAGHAVRI
ncbi:MAG: imidazole glycerol phosphate synthase subunit HisF [Rhodospirillaceae bacterium]